MTFLSPPPESPIFGITAFKAKKSSGSRNFGIKRISQRSMKSFQKGSSIHGVSMEYLWSISSLRRSAVVKLQLTGLSVCTVTYVALSVAQLRSFQLRTRNSIRGFVRPFVHLSVGPSVGPSVSTSRKVGQLHFRPCPPVCNWWPCIQRGYFLMRKLKLSID